MPIFSFPFSAKKIVMAVKAGGGTDLEKNRQLAQVRADAKVCVMPLLLSPFLLYSVIFCDILFFCYFLFFLLYSIISFHIFLYSVIFCNIL